MTYPDGDFHAKNQVDEFKHTWTDANTGIQKSRITKLSAGSNPPPGGYDYDHVAIMRWVRDAKIGMGSTGTKQFLITNYGFTSGYLESLPTIDDMCVWHYDTNYQAGDNSWDEIFHSHVPDSTYATLTGIVYSNRNNSDTVDTDQGTQPKSSIWPVVSADILFTNTFR